MIGVLRHTVEVGLLEIFPGINQGGCRLLLAELVLNYRKLCDGNFKMR